MIDFMVKLALWLLCAYSLVRIIRNDVRKVIEDALKRAGLINIETLLEPPRDMPALRKSRVPREYEPPAIEQTIDLSVNTKPSVWCPVAEDHVCRRTDCVGANCVLVSKGKTDGERKV